MTEKSRTPWRMAPVFAAITLLSAPMSGPEALGVNVVVHVILLPLASVTGGAATQLVVAPVGAPLTAQVAFTALCGPLFVQLVTTVTGVPTVTVCAVAPVAAMSALAAGVLTVHAAPQLGLALEVTVFTIAALLVSGLTTLTVNVVLALPP